MEIKSIKHCFKNTYLEFHALSGAPTNNICEMVISLHILDVFQIVSRIDIS